MPRAGRSMVSFGWAGTTTCIQRRGAEDAELAEPLEGTLRPAWTFFPPIRKLAASHGCVLLSLRSLRPLRLCVGCQGLLQPQQPRWILAHHAILIRIAHAFLLESLHHQHH